MLEAAWKRYPIVFQGHPSNFKVTRLRKSSIWTQIWHFRMVIPVWTHQGLEMMHKALSNIDMVAHCFSRSSVKFQGHTAQLIIDFDPNWVFLDCNSSLNKPMTMKWCTKLEAALERCPIVFQGHLSNFKVTWDKISLILTWIEYFRPANYTLTLSQWSSNGNPVAIQCAWNLDPSVHWNATGERIVGSQCASSGFPVVFQCVPIMQINTGSPLGHH